MHSTNIDNLSRMARECNCSIFVKNGRSQAGLGLDGEGYTSFTIASPTGEGLTGPAVVLALAPLRDGRPLQDHLMKKAPALAVIEFSDIPIGIDATDAMLKKAPIAFVKSRHDQPRPVPHADRRHHRGGRGIAARGPRPRGRARHRPPPARGRAPARLRRHPRRPTRGRQRRPRHHRDRHRGVQRAGGRTGAEGNARRTRRNAAGRLGPLREGRQHLPGRPARHRGGRGHRRAATCARRAATSRHTIISSPHEALARQIGSGTSFGSAALLDLDGEVG